MAATSVGSPAVQDLDFSQVGAGFKSQDQINAELQGRISDLEASQGAADADPFIPYSDDTCDDPDCGCQDDEGVVGGMYPEPTQLTIEDVVQSVIEITQVGIDTLKDIALNSDDDMAAVEAADSLIGWGQVAAEKIDAIERDALILEVEEILNAIIGAGEIAGQDADRS